MVRGTGLASEEFDPPGETGDEEESVEENAGRQGGHAARRGGGGPSGTGGWRSWMARRGRYAVVGDLYESGSGMVPEEGEDPTGPEGQGPQGSSGTEGKDDGKSEVKMWEHQVSVPELEERLLTSIEDGLTTSEADVRLARDGLNVLRPGKATHWSKKLLAQFTNFFALLLEGAGILCFISFALESDSSDNLYLGLVLWFVVIVTAIFSFAQEYKSEKTMEQFKNFLPPQALVIRDGNTVQIDAAMIAVGDIVVINAGDKIPADIRMVSVSKLKVDNSSLTGESEPLSRCVDCTDENPLETHNLAFFGTLAVEGTGKGMVVNTGDRTVFGRIARLAATAGTKWTTLRLEIHHFVVLISIVAVSLGGVFFLIGALKGVKLLDNFVFSIGIIVANVPEGLLATVTVSSRLTAKRMAKKNVLVKKLESVETLGSTSTICSDKTGTLTQNRMTVMHIMYDGEVYQTRTATTNATYDRDHPVFGDLLLGACLCAKAVFDATDAEQNPELTIDERKVNGDASEAGILKFAEKITSVMDVRSRNPLKCVLPFDSTHKFMISVHSDESYGGQYRLVMKGAPERVLDRCHKVLTADGVQDMSVQDLERINGLLNSLMNAGERVLAFAQRMLPQDRYGPDYEFETEKPDFVDVMLEDDLCFVGLVSLLDPPRESVPHAVRVCQDAGIKVIMVTGDHPCTAKSIAKQVHIISEPTVEDLAEERGVAVADIDPTEAKAIVIPGSEIKTLGEEDWNRVLAKEQIVFARTSPQQKLLIVENCQRLGQIVAVTGDGVNDSPALKKANIGVAMGISGSDVSKEAADMVILDDNFSSIVNGVEEGRLIFDNLKKSICYTLTSNIPEITPFVLYSLLAVPLPLTAVLILCIDLGTDMLPAIALAYEKAEKDIMCRPPRNAEKDRLVNRRLLVFSYMQIGILQAVAGILSYLVVFNDYGLKPGLVVGLDAQNFFASKLVHQERWLYSLHEERKVPAHARHWFDNNTRFEDFFDGQAAGFLQQESDQFSALTSEPGDIPGIDVLTDVPGLPSNPQFNNMVKIIGSTEVLPPCLQFVCVIGGELQISKMDCFDSAKNPGPVYYNGINTGALNTNVDGGCFQLWQLKQQRSLLAHAQCAFFVCIIVVQWSDLLICKTRSLSLFQQGMKNQVLNAGLVVETALAAIILYIPFVNTGLKTAPIRFIHWLPGVPFSLLELVYDETRKGFMRLEHGTGSRLGAWLRTYSYW